MSRQIVVLSTGRAGSSMLAQILEALGVYMGFDPTPADRFNAQGYYEDTAFKAVNSWLLTSSTLRPAESASPEMQAHMTRLVAERDACHDLWGWKDNTTILTATLWEPLLSDPKWIAATRNEEATVASTRRKYPAAFDHHIRYNYRVLVDRLAWFCEGRDVLRLDYDDLLERRDVGQIAAFIGAEDNEKARAIIKPELRTVT